MGGACHGGGILASDNLVYSVMDLDLCFEMQAICDLGLFTYMKINVLFNPINNGCRCFYVF